MKLPQIKMPNFDRLLTKALATILTMPLITGVIDGVWYVLNSTTIINKQWDWYAVALVVVLTILGVAFNTYLINNKE